MATIKPSGLFESHVSSSFEDAGSCYSSTETESGVACDSFSKTDVDASKLSSRLIFKQGDAQKQAGSGLSEDAVGQAERYQRWQEAQELSLRYQRWQEAQELSLRYERWQESLEQSIRYAEWQSGQAAQVTEPPDIDDLPITRAQRRTLKGLYDELRALERGVGDISRRSTVDDRLSKIDPLLRELTAFVEGLGEQGQDPGILAHVREFTERASVLRMRLQTKIFELRIADIPHTSRQIDQLFTQDEQNVYGPVDAQVRACDALVDEINASYRGNAISQMQQEYLKTLLATTKARLLVAWADKAADAAAACTHTERYAELRNYATSAIVSARDYVSRVERYYSAYNERWGSDSSHLDLPRMPAFEIPADLPETCARCPAPVAPQPPVEQPGWNPEIHVPPQFQQTPLQRYTQQINEAVPHGEALLQMTSTRDVDNALTELRRQERAVGNEDDLSDTDKTALRELLAGYRRQLEFRKLEIVNTQEAVNDLDSISTLTSRLTDMAPYIADPVLQTRASVVQARFFARLNTLFTEKINDLPTNAMAVERQRDVNRHLETIGTLRTQITNSGLDDARRNALLGRLTPIETALQAVRDNWSPLQDVRALARTAQEKINDLLELLQAYETARSALAAYGQRCTSHDEFDRLQRARTQAMAPLAGAKREAEDAIRGAQQALNDLGLPADVRAAIQIPSLPSGLNIPDPQAPSLFICVPPISTGSIPIITGGSTGAAQDASEQLMERLREILDPIFSQAIQDMNLRRDASFEIKITVNVHFEGDAICPRGGIHDIRVRQTEGPSLPQAVLDSIRTAIENAQIRLTITESSVRGLCEQVDDGWACNLESRTGIDVGYNFSSNWSLQSS